MLIVDVDCCVVNYCYMFCATVFLRLYGFVVFKHVGSGIKALQHVDVSFVRQY